MSSAAESSAYDNSKQLRRESSFSSLYDQVYVKARSPSEIMSSFYEEGMSLKLVAEATVSILFFFFGCYAPKVFQYNGYLNIRPIPYQVTQAGDVLLDLTLSNELIPKSEATFPGWKLWFVSLWVPFCVVAVGAIFPLVISTLPNNNSVHNVHAGVCTLLVAIGLSELVTQTFKLYVGRLRPNFYAMCGFNTQTLSCDNGEEMEMEARMSFPSGHSSLSFCGMVVLTLFLVGRVGLGRSIIPKTAYGKGKLKLLFSFAPLLLCFWVSTSRLVDDWHHPSDIIVGSALGSICGCISYHLFFPHVFSPLSGVPVSVQCIDVTPEREADHITLEKSLSLPIYSSA